MRHGFRIQKHDAYAAFAAVFCPDLETSPDLHSCDRNWNFWLPKSPKKKLPKCWFLNFHQIITTWTAWIFPGIKKNTWPFMAIYRTNQKVSCFFPKIWTPTQKIRIHLQQKTCFWYSSILLKLVGQSRRMHTLTFLAPKPESSVCDGGCCPW